MTRLLPEVPDLAAYQKIYRDAGAWLPALHEICRREGLDAGALEMAPPGSHVVFWAGSGRLIKLFCRLWPDDALAERLSLATLTACPDIPVPRMIAGGELEGWPYLVLEPASGTPLCEVWAEAPLDDRLGICRRLGEVLAALHAVPTDSLEPLASDWAAFLTRRRAAQRAEQLERGADAAWLPEIDAFLDAAPPPFEPGFRPVLLNADVTDEHVLLGRSDGHWRMSGLIDFGDAMVGDPLYEFVATTIITGNDERLRRALFRGYGFTDEALDDALTQRLTVYAFLHQFTNLKWYLELAGDPAPRTIAELQRALWSFSQPNAGKAGMKWAMTETNL